MTSERLIVAIDGPASAGKSTLARMLAERLGVPYLNTGAMYRALALFVDENAVPLDDGSLVDALARCGLVLRQDGAHTHVYLGTREVTEAVRREAIGDLASRVSVFEGVRAEMVARQRQLGAEWGGVIEGRDIATVVFPDAPVKFFLTASVTERARRRAAELRAAGHAANDVAMRREVEERDFRDSNRATAPLRLAPGAVVVDTTGKDTGAVLQILLNYIDILR